MRASVPDGDLAAIIELAVSEKLERLEARRFGRTRAKGEVRPAATTPALEDGPATRHIPAAVKRAVYERDGGRCRYVDGQGRRCPARDGLEFHHRHPFGFGGDHSVDELCLLCRAHNRYLADVDYGRARMAPQRRSPSRRFDSATSPLEPAAPPSP